MSKSHAWPPPEMQKTSIFDLMFFVDIHIKTSTLYISFGLMFDLMFRVNSETLWFDVWFYVLLTVFFFFNMQFWCDISNEKINK